MLEGLLLKSEGITPVTGTVLPATLSSKSELCRVPVVRPKSKLSTKLDGAELATTVDTKIGAPSSTAVDAAMEVVGMS